jgi:CRP/FNR family cyclic AMP-dependent transcriptional regulator
MDEKQNIQDIVDKFKQIGLFAALAGDAAALSRAAALFTTIKSEAGSSVIREGEAGDTMYIIKAGTVEIVKKTMPGDPYTVAELSADKNMFFGEMALIDEDRRSAGVICKTDCEFYVLTRARFLELGDAHPAIGLAITRELARSVSNRLRKANGDIITLFDALVGEVAESGGLGQ